MIRQWDPPEDLVAMITLYQWEMSPFCDKVRRVLNVKRQAYEIRELNLQALLSGKMKKLNPTGKVPALDHDGRFIGDSTDIALYLEEKFPDPPLVPRDPAARALVHVLEDWADESLYFFEMHLRLAMPHNALKWIPELTKNDNGFVRTVAKLAVPRQVRATTIAQGTGRKSPATLRSDLERHIGSVSELLGDRQWLVGDALTLADIAVFAQLFCIRATVEGWSIVHAWPKVAEWMDRVDAASSAHPHARVAE